MIELTQVNTDGEALRPASFSMKFSPTTLLISVVRRFVLALYERILGDGALSSEMALATHELLENSVKYSKNDAVTFEVNVTARDAGYEILVVTRNVADQADAARVREMIDALRDADDVFAFYQQLMHETVERAEGSGLGLARIETETDLSLDYVIEGERVEIIARCTYTQGARQ